MPFVNKPAILARAIAIIVLVSLLIVAVTAFIERNTFDRLDDLNGPTEVSHISDQGRSDWNRFASGEPSRLAILLTDKDSAWLGLAHGLKSIGVPFTITDDVAEATRHNVVLVYPLLSGRTLDDAGRTALRRHVEAGRTLRTL